MQNNNQQSSPDEAVKQLSKIEEGFLLTLRFMAEINVKLNIDISNSASEFEMSAPIVQRIRGDITNQASKLNDVLAAITSLKQAIN